MWVFLSGGFVSIVAHRDRPGDLMVRARDPEHLRQIWPDAEVQLTPKADYPARIVVPRRVVRERLAQEVDDLQYPNFKASLTDDAYHDLCLDVWSTHARWGVKLQHVKREPPVFITAFEGSSLDALDRLPEKCKQQADLASPEEKTSRNLRMSVGCGSLTLCDLLDFRETLRDDHTVVTLCRHPPAFLPEGPTVPWVHRYFRAYEQRIEPWLIAIEEVRCLIEEGRDVLLHCVHGRDRTGVVAYAVLRSFGYGHEEVVSQLCAHRPRMAEVWPRRLAEPKAIQLGSLSSSTYA